MDSATPDPNDYLMVDTQFFPPEFKSRLLSFIPDFDAQCDGLLIHSENFQALNLLQERYREQVKCIYIDPPYNTGNDGFIYRDNFQHSSWLSMMEDRLSVSRNLMNDEAAIYISIDDNEIANLKALCNNSFGQNNFIAQLIWERAFSPKNDARYISNSHDYVLFFAKDKESFVIGRLPRTESANQRYSNPDNDPRGVWMSDNIVVKTYTPSCDFPVKTPSGRIVNPPPGRCWRLSQSAFLERIKDNRIWFGPNGDGVPRIKRFLSELKFDGMAPTSILFYKEVGHSQEGAQDLVAILNDGSFNGPKPIRLIYRIITLSGASTSSTFLDFFAGSGTTAHAVINLNREDGGNRKYILVEMGDHFNTVLKPRIEKVVYSPDWKDGKPTSFDKGVSHCFKYMRLESYEDTLNNLELPETDPIASSMPPSLHEDYMLHYLLDTEANATLLDIDMFKNPFGGYRLKIKRPGSEACDETPVDLIETFNYLIGLRVSQYYLPRRYSVRFKRAVDPELPGEEGSRRLVLDGRPKLDDAGKWSFLRLEGVVPAHPLNPNNGQTKRVLVIWRNLTGDMEQDNAVLDWFADDLRLNDKVPEYDIVYVNGCNNLGADRKETDSYQVRLIEEEFFRKMWG